MQGFKNSLHLSSTSADRWVRTMSFGLAPMWLHWPRHLEDLIMVDDLGIPVKPVGNSLLYFPSFGTLYIDTVWIDIVEDNANLSGMNIMKTVSVRLKDTTVPQTVRIGRWMQTIRASYACTSRQNQWAQNHV